MPRPVLSRLCHESNPATLSFVSFFLINFKIKFYLSLLCVHDMRVYEGSRQWRSQGSFVEPVLSSLCVGSRDGTQVAELACQALYITTERLTGSTLALEGQLKPKQPFCYTIYLFLIWFFPPLLELESRFLVHVGQMLIYWVKPPTLNLNLVLPFLFKIGLSSELWASLSLD